MTTNCRNCGIGEKYLGEDKEAGAIICTNCGLVYEKLLSDDRVYRPLGIPKKNPFLEQFSKYKIPRPSGIPKRHPLSKQLSKDKIQLWYCKRCFCEVTNIYLRSKSIDDKNVLCYDCYDYSRSIKPDKLNN